MSLHGGSCDIPKQEMELMLKPLKHKFSYGGIIDRLLHTRCVPESQADMLLALSKSEVAKLQSLYPEKAVKLFPNGITHRELSDATGFRERYNIGNDKKIILCISRIDYQKNQGILLDLLQKTSDTHLLLIGPVTAKWYYDEIINLADKLQLQERMTIIPGLKFDSDELLQSLAASYCFILPSRHEPFGIVALEALDAKLPLIAAEVGGLKDFLVNEENAILFEDNNSDALFSAYQKLDSLREKLILNGQITAQEYNWQSISNKLKDIYLEMCQCK
jgi:glycosyltransferase involved in cell wall biosynthesis